MSAARSANEFARLRSSHCRNALRFTEEPLSA
jgi:hypothetical protein